MSEKMNIYMDEYMLSFGPIKIILLFLKLLLFSVFLQVPSVICSY